VRTAVCRTSLAFSDLFRRYGIRIGMDTTPRSSPISQEPRPTPTMNAAISMDDTHGTWSRNRSDAIPVLSGKRAVQADARQRRLRVGQQQEDGDQQ
jgi:hypothetical protein